MCYLFAPETWFCEREKCFASNCDPRTYSQSCGRSLGFLEVPPAKNQWLLQSRQDPSSCNMTWRKYRPVARHLRRRDFRRGTMNERASFADFFTMPYLDGRLNKYRSYLRRRKYYFHIRRALRGARRDAQLADDNATVIQ